MFFESLAGLVGGTSWSSAAGVSVGILGGINVPDVAGTGTNVAAKVEPPRARKLLEQAERSRDRMLEAKRAISPDAALNRVARALRSGS